MTAGVAGTTTPRNVAELLIRAAELWGDRTFLRDAVTGRALNFRVAANEAARLAAALRHRGIRRGDRVLVLAESRVEVPLLAFAAARLGAVFCLLHEGLTGATAAAVLAQARPRVVVLTDATWRFAECCSAGLPVHLNVLVEDAANASGKWDGAPCPCAADEPAGLVFTSGSTGTPSGVVITHGNVLFTARAIQDRLRYQADDVVGLFLPFSFDYGLYQVFLAALSGAAVLVGGARHTGPGVLRLLRAERVTVVPVVPTMLTALLPMMRGRNDFPTLRCITSTGEHLPRAHLDRLAALLPGVRVFAMYGLTECKRICILLPEESVERPESVGRPLDGVSVRIVDESGATLPAGTPGEIRVRGPNVAAGYWRAPAATRRRFLDVGGGRRELATGDYGWMDADGFMYVRGRRDGLLKHRGFRMGADEVESAARELDGVLDAALVRVDERDELHLFLATEGTDVLPERIAADLAERLEAHKVPERVHCLRALPMRATGKVDRERLLATARAGANA